MATQYEKRNAKKADAPVEVQPTYTHVAYDIVWDDELRGYYRIDVEYNAADGTARVKDRKKIADSQPVATMKMNELFTRKVLKLPYT